MRSVLGIAAGVLVFLLSAVCWNYAVLWIFVLWYIDRPKEFGTTPHVVGALVAYVPTALLAGLAFLVGSRIAGRRAGMLSALVSACAMIAVVALFALLRVNWFERY